MSGNGIRANSAYDVPYSLLSEVIRSGNAPNFENRNVWYRTCLLENQRGTRLNSFTDRSILSENDRATISPNGYTIVIDPRMSVAYSHAITARILIARLPTIGIRGISYSLTPVATPAAVNSSFFNTRSWYTVNPISNEPSIHATAVA